MREECGLRREERLVIVVDDVRDVSLFFLYISLFFLVIFRRDGWGGSIEIPRVSNLIT